MSMKPTMWFPGFRASHPLAVGCVGYWPIWAGRGAATAMDVSGNGNNGLLRNMDPATDWVPTSRGPSLSFVYDQYARFDNLPSLSGAWSLHVRFKPITAAGTGHNIPLGDRDSSFFTHHDTGYVRAYCEGTSRDATSTPAPVSGTWETLVWSYDGAIHRCYLDGVPVGATPAGAGDVFHFASIGRGFTTTHDSIMDIDVASAYARALTASEAHQLTFEPYALITRRRKTYFWAAASGGGAPPAGNRRRRLLIAG